MMIHRAARVRENGKEAILVARPPHPEDLMRTLARDNVQDIRRLFRAFDHAR